jgi:hypothetical protein
VPARRPKAPAKSVQNPLHPPLQQTTPASANKRRFRSPRAPGKLLPKSLYPPRTPKQSSHGAPSCYPFSAKGSPTRNSRRRDWLSGPFVASGHSSPSSRALPSTPDGRR